MKKSQHDIAPTLSQGLDILVPLQFMLVLDLVLTALAVLHEASAYAMIRHCCPPLCPLQAWEWAPS